MNKGETIIELLGEGGSIILRGLLVNDEWFFTLEMNELALREVFDEKDETLYLSESDYVKGLQEGIKLLDQYPWANLNPRNIHPKFASELYKEAKKRIPAKDEFRLSSWEEALENVKK